MAAGDVTLEILGGLSAAPFDDPSLDGWVGLARIEGWGSKFTAQGDIEFDFGAGYGNQYGQDATVATGILVDWSTAKMIFTITSEGHDDAGNLTTRARFAYASRVLRKVDPLDAEDDIAVDGADLLVKVALSEFVYDDDKAGGAGTSGTDPTVIVIGGWARETAIPANVTNAVSAGAVTNNSILDYPKVVGRFVWPSFYTVGGDFLLEAECFQHFGMNAKPVACVKFDAQDASLNSAPTQTVTDMTLTTRTHPSGLKPSVYAATMPVANLTQGEAITCNFKAYPWIGDADSVLDTRDGTPPPSPTWGPVVLYCNKDGTFNPAPFVAVAPGGADSGQGSFATEAEARAQPYATIPTALAGLAQPSGGECVLEEGAYPLTADAALNLGSMTAWVTIRPATGTDPAAVLIDQATTPANDIWTGRIKIEGVGRFKDNAQIGILRGDNTTKSATWVDGVLDVSLTANVAYIYNQAAVYFTDNTLNALGNDIGERIGWSGNGSIGGTALMRGNDYTATAVRKMYNHGIMVANKGPIAFIDTTTAMTAPQGDNYFSAYCWAVVGNEGFHTDLHKASDRALVHGAFFAGGIIERSGSATSYVMLQVAADNYLDHNPAVDHLGLWHMTVEGERVNICYNAYPDIIAVPMTNVSLKYSSIRDMNNKDDTFGGEEDPTHTGSWPVGYRTGAVGMVGSANTIPWETLGMFGKYQSATYVKNGSFDGDNTGISDFTPAPGSSLLNVIPGDAHRVLPFDLFGNPIAGNGDAGAVQLTVPVAPFAPAGNRDFGFGFGFRKAA